MPTLQDLAAQLVGEIPGLSFLFARKYVLQALDEISRDYLWSWNINEGMIIIPQLVADGTVTVTNFSNQIQFDSQAKTVLDTLVLANPPLIERQFRTMGGPIYNIIGYDTDTGIATLDRIYIANSAAQQEYQIYKCYYGPPSVDGVTPDTNFLRYLTINDPINGYTISGKNLTMTRETLNRRDPMRGAQGQMYYAASYKPSPASNGTFPNGVNVGYMQYEFWPHPVFGQQLLAQYAAKTISLQTNQELPAQLSPQLVRYKAQEFALRWAQQNVGRVPELKGVNWPLLLAEAQRKYAFDLVGAKRDDTEITFSILRPGNQNIMNFFGPVDSNWAQSHGVPQW